MTNKYCNLTGTNKIKEDYTKINDGFAEVEADKATQDARTQAHVNGTAEKHAAEHVTYSGAVTGANMKEAVDNLKTDINNISMTGSEHDALVTAALVDEEGTDFGAGGTGTGLEGRLSKWEQKHIAHLAENVAQFALKVDKIAGKGLSANDYTNTDKAEVAKVANKTDKAYVDNLAASLASGSPKGTYATLAALQAAIPAGNTNIYVVTADGKWYYWNGAAWTAGGTYQSTGLFTLTNKATKGNFPDTTEWTEFADSVLTVSGGVMIDTCNGGSKNPYIKSIAYITGVASGTKVHVKTLIRVTNSECEKIEVYPCYTNTGAGTKLSGVQLIANPVINQWYDISSVTEFKSSDANFAIGNIMTIIQTTYASTAVSNGKVFEVKEFYFINETTDFGAGYELTAGEMDNLLKDIPWFTTKDVFNPKKIIFDINYLGRRIDGATGTAESVLDYATPQLALDSSKSVYFPDGIHLASGLASNSCPGISGNGNGSIVKSNADETLLTISNGNFDIDKLTFEGANNAAYTNEKGVSITGDLIYNRIANSDFKNFKGHSALYNTNNAGWRDTLMVSNCHFMLNKVGYYSDTRGEYATFTNCHFSRNTIGALIKGGNNHLDGCQINDNVDGVQIIGVAGGNDGHGLITNCQINHSTGYGIKIDGIHYGYTIANVHMYDGKFLIQNITGAPVRIMNSYIDAETFEILNCELVCFYNCYIANAYMGAGSPTITNSTIKGSGNICTNPTWEAMFNK